MSESRQIAVATPTTMFISAAVFAFFTFFVFSWANPPPNRPLFLAIFEWTLKTATFSFAISGVLTLAHRMVGNLFYSVASLLCALSFAVIAVLDFLDKQWTAFMYSPLILAVLAVWNGFGGWSGLQAVMAARRGPAGDP